MTRKNAAQERIENIKAQIEAYESGYQHTITCPYCGGINRKDVEFCCDLFGKASIAALERLRVEQATEIVEAVERHANN